MTNEEKFKEVFGYGPCCKTPCRECPHHRDVEICLEEQFWDAEYTGPLEVHENVTHE